MPKDLTKGEVCLVGAGPGDPELLTIKAFRMLQEADVVVHDRLVSPEILDLIPRRAKRIDVGKRPDHHPAPQAEINALLTRLALQGRRVVRLKGGDPLIFGRGSEEAAALRAADVAVRFAPGITAAQGVAASTGVPLTHRGLATGVRFVTGHCRANGPLDLDWAGLADPDTTLVVYMGRANMSQIARALLAHGLPDAHPVLVVANGTRPNESRFATRLGALQGEPVSVPAPGPVLFIIGRVVTLAEEASADAAETAKTELAAASVASILNAPEFQKVLHG